VAASKDAPDARSECVSPGFASDHGRGLRTTSAAKDGLGRGDSDCASLGSAETFAISRPGACRPHHTFARRPTDTSVGRAESRKEERLTLSSPNRKSSSSERRSRSPGFAVTVDSHVPVIGDVGDNSFTGGDEAIEREAPVATRVDHRRRRVWIMAGLALAVMIGVTLGAVALTWPSGSRPSVGRGSESTTATSTTTSPTTVATTTPSTLAAAPPPTASSPTPSPRPPASTTTAPLARPPDPVRTNPPPSGLAPSNPAPPEPAPEPTTLPSSPPSTSPPPTSPLPLPSSPSSSASASRPER
jgi:hypothetical protein